MTKVVNIRIEECDVYIGRHKDPIIGKWGCPYTTKESNIAKFKVATKEEALRLYKEYILSTPELLNSLYELKGKKLGCFCKQEGKSVPCHGDILVQLINELDKGFEL